MPADDLTDHAAASREDLARRVHEAAHLTGEFVLRSGAVSNEYFDKYRFEADPELLRELCEHMAALVPDDADALAGLEMGGIPIATMLSQVTGLPARFVRKEAKSYGTCRLAEGGDIASERLVVVEDVVTSGGQVVTSCGDLRARGATIAAVLCVIDRQAGGPEALAADGLELRALFTADELRAAVGGVDGGSPS